MGVEGNDDMDTKMKPFEEKTVAIKNGETLFYRFRKGGNHKLVLLHGNMSSSANFDILMNEISTEFTIYALDQRGFGDSSYEKTADSIKAYADDLAQFAKAVELESFDLLGWSFGGNVAMRFAIDHKKMLNKLVLLSAGGLHGFPVEKRRFFGLIPTGKYLSSKEDIQKSVKPIEKIREKKQRKILQMVFNRTLYSNKKPNKARYVKYEKAFFQQRNLVDVNYALAHFNLTDTSNGVVDGTNEVSKIEVPVLIMHGKLDKIVPYSVAEETSEKLKNAEFKSFEEGSHALFVDETKTVCTTIFDFLVGT